MALAQIRRMACREGHCQVTVVDAEGHAEIVISARRPLVFSEGHGHAIQRWVRAPCHAILAFDDGLYSEHGTSEISDWMSRYDTLVLSQALGVSSEAFAHMPKAETYIMQGEVLPLDGPQATLRAGLDSRPNTSYALMAQKPRVSTPGGTAACGIGRGISDVNDVGGDGSEVEAGAMHEPHWQRGCQ